MQNNKKYPVVIPNTFKETINPKLWLPDEKLVNRRDTHNFNTNIGISLDSGENLHINLSLHPNMLITYIPGGGKNIVLHTILSRIAQKFSPTQASFYLYTPMFDKKIANLPHTILMCNHMSYHHDSGMHTWDYFMDCVNSEINDRLDFLNILNSTGYSFNTIREYRVWRALKIRFMGYGEKTRFIFDYPPVPSGVVCVSAHHCELDFFANLVNVVRKVDMNFIYTLPYCKYDRVKDSVVSGFYTRLCLQKLCEGYIMFTNSFVQV